MRETFALRPVTPAPIRPHLTGQTRGAQIVGGQSQGGVVHAGPQTDPGPAAAGLGAVFEEIMRPHVAKRQQEEFFKGFTKAQEGVAIGEISKSGSSLSKIFGPTAFEEGAAFYTAQTKLTDWAQARYDEMDTLKRLPPEEQAKLLAEKSQELMTGDVATDQLIQRGLMDQSGPLMNTIGKARYAWQQQEAVNAFGTAGRSSATALQKAAQAIAGLTDPSDEQTAAMVTQANSYAASMAKPHGMDDETYRKGLFDHVRQAMQEGNFHAVRVLKARGVLGLFNDGELEKLENAEHRYSERVLERASIDLLVGDMADYESKRIKGQMTPLEATKALMRMNAKVRLQTGVEKDIFDFGDIRGEVRSTAELIRANWQRAQDRAWQIEDRELAREERRQERTEELAETSRFAGAAWASGDVERAMAEGIEERHFNRIALAEFRSGNVAGLARAFSVGHYVSSSVRQDILAGVEGSLEQQYGKNFQKAHQQWQAMMKASPGMTSRYFGEYHEKMRAFTTLSQQLGPMTAYTRAFGDPARYADSSVPDGRRKEVRTAIDAWASSQQPSRLNIFAYRLDASSLTRLKAAMERRLGAALRNSDEPAEALISEVGQAIFADGSTQIVGGKVWSAKPGTKPFRVQVGLQQDEADMVFREVVDARLKRAGLEAGIGADLSVSYVRNPQGKTVLHVVGRDGEGQSATALIPLTEFKEAHRNRLAGTPAEQAARRAVQQGLDPRRRIPGEKGWQRVVRINLENAARARSR